MVGEVGAEEAVAEEAGGGAGEADAGVALVAGPLVGAVEVQAGDFGVGAEAVAEVVALQRVADGEDQEQSDEAAETRDSVPAGGSCRGRGPTAPSGS